MVSQIRQMQQWAARREATLARYEGVWRSARQMQQQQQALYLPAAPAPAASPEPAGMSLRDESSLQSHVDALRRLDRELQEDLSVAQQQQQQQGTIDIFSHVYAHIIDICDVQAAGSSG